MTWPCIDGHNILSIDVNYELGHKPVKEHMFLLDSARRLKELYFSKAPWKEIWTKFAAVDWSPMSYLARGSPTPSHF